VRYETEDPGCRPTSRREVLRLAGGMALGILASGESSQESSSKQDTRKAEDAADHLLLGVHDLDQGMALVSDQTGLKPLVGGVHPGMGTRNALLSLGRGQYLEIIAPDPAQENFAFQIDLRKFSRPQLVTWAVRSEDINATAQRARRAGLQVFGPRDGSRKRPDGRVLRWRSLAVQHAFGSERVDPIPFFIEWGADSPHPSLDALTSCRLQSFELSHPKSGEVGELLRNLEIDMRVQRAQESAFRATFRTPKGPWVVG